MYVIYNVISKVGWNGGVNAKTLADTIKNEIGQNSNIVNTQDISKLDGTVKSILSKTQNLPKEEVKGGKFGNPTAEREMLNQLR